MRSIITIVLAAALAACSKDEAPQSKGAAAFGDRMQFPVEVVTVQLQTVTYAVSAVGSVEAFETVQVTARVPGVVETVRFSEGRYVRQGQALVDIEPERYRLSVKSAEAALEKARAALLDTEASLSRRESVDRNTPGLIPGEELESWRTRVRSAQADLASAEAAFEQAGLNLRDALVKAPISGIVQTRSAQTGQYVQPGNVLATLLRRDPMLLRFRVPEQDASRIRVGIKAFFRVRNDEREYSSLIKHVAASADERTRMVEVTAEIIDEKREALRPGAFAEVTVPVRENHGAPVVPQTSIRPSERGFLAYVVENEKAVERILTLGMRTEDGNIEVLSGLKQGETLVVRGGEALRDGAAVRTVPPDAKQDAEQGKGAGKKNE